MEFFIYTASQTEDFVDGLGGRVEDLELLGSLRNVQALVVDQVDELSAALRRDGFVYFRHLGGGSLV